MKLIYLLIILISLFSTVVVNAKNIINTYDLTYINKLSRTDLTQTKRIWDECHFVSSIQGIANQNSPNLYIFFVGDNRENETNGFVDKYWFKKLTSDGDWMDDWQINEIKNLDELVSTFKNDFNGLVVYDENVPATSNIATTIAGVEKLACIRFDKDKDSLYYHLVNNLKIPVKKWLVNKDGSSLFTGTGIIPETDTKSTGSAKCDAYMWAKLKYLDTGKCTPGLLGYYMDAYWIKIPVSYIGDRISNHSLSSHDYIIANKGFAFELSPWEDEAPNDDLTQPIGTDYATFLEIMHSAYKQNQGKIIHVTGFLAWDKKYTSYSGGKYEPVQSEWKYAEILSCFNGYLDPEALADSSMANASVFSKYELKDKYEQKKPTIDDLKKMGLILPDGKVKEASYVCIYVGDYDCAAWLYQHVPDIWDDEMRGEFPMGWAFGGHLANRFPYGMDYVRKTATANDYFIAADGAGGYHNPGHLVEPRKYSGLPSGVQAWKEHSEKLMDRFDLSIIGFIIDGFAPSMNEELLDLHAKLAPDGIAAQRLSKYSGIHKEMPFITMHNEDPIVPNDAYKILKKMGKEVPEFFMIRNVLWTIPQQKEYKDIIKKELNGDVEFLGPYHFFLLLKYFHEQNQKARYIGDGNLFDYRNNIEITSHSPLIGGFNIMDMFSANLGTAPEREVTIFSEENSNGNHFVEWNTQSPINISKIIFEGCPYNDRETDKIKILCKENISDDWKILVDFEPNHPMEKEYTFQINTPYKMKFFRAEFTENHNPERKSSGIRICELKAF